MAASEVVYVAIRPDVIHQQLERINVYLNEAGEDRYVSRAVWMDLEPMCRVEVRRKAD